METTSFVVVLLVHDVFDVRAGCLAKGKYEKKDVMVLIFIVILLMVNRGERS